MMQQRQQQQHQFVSFWRQSKCSFMLLLILFASLCCCVSAQQQQCTFLPNYNTTASDLPDIPPKFVVSAQDCCNYCMQTPKCYGAVFASYYCYLKGDIGEVQSVAGPTYITSPLASSTTTTTTTTSRAPTTTTTTTTTTTAAPTTAAPTTTTTAAPTSTAAPTTSAPTTSTTAAPTASPTTPTPTTPPTNITLIREVFCDYSNACNRWADSSCKTKAYINNSCSQKRIRMCGGDFITVESYSQEGCAVLTSQTSEPENVCKMTENDQYIGHYCNVEPYPESGIVVERSSCPYGCNVGSECVRSRLVTGNCTTENPLNSMRGSSVMAWCFSEFIVFFGYDTSDCSGEFVDSVSEPIGTNCFLDNNQGHIRNMCGAS